MMAQGAAGSAIEDAVVLAHGPDELRVYEETRCPRTSQLQIGSRANDWIRGVGLWV